MKTLLQGFQPDMPDSFLDNESPNGAVFWSPGFVQLQVLTFYLFI